MSEISNYWIHEDRTKVLVEFYN